MSPASYRTAPPRVAGSTVGEGGRGLQILRACPALLLEQVEVPGHLGACLVAEADPVGAPALPQRLVRRGEVGLRPLQQRLRPGHGSLSGAVRPALVGPALVPAFVAA